MHYKTHVFEEQKRKKRNYNIPFYVTVIVLIGLIVLGVYYLGVGGLLLPAITLIMTFYQHREEDRKDAGITLYGKRKADLIIDEDHLEVQRNTIRYSEVTNLTIYVDEFTGMTRNFFWSHHGGDNEICFDHNGKHYSFNYIMRNKKDFLHVENLVATIEAKYPTSK